MDFTSALLILFIGLKLTGYVAWPWLWVMAPLWVPLIIYGLVAVAALVWTRS